MIRIINQTIICGSCKYEWDITEFRYEDFVICPKCKHKTKIGVRITSVGNS